MPTPTPPPVPHEAEATVPVRHVEGGDWITVSSAMTRVWLLDRSDLTEDDELLPMRYAPGVTVVGWVHNVHWANNFVILTIGKPTEKHLNVLYTVMVSRRADIVSHQIANRLSHDSISNLPSAPHTHPHPRSRDE